MRSTSKPDRRHRRPPRRIARFVVQLVLTALLFEIGLRLIGRFSNEVRALLYLPQIDTRFDQVSSLPDLLRHSPLGWSPHETYAGFRLNARSFRTHDYERPRDADTYRIMVLGDSYTFSSGGVAFEDMWHSHVARALNRTPGPNRVARVEVFALGVPGIGPLFERRLWQLEHRRVDPDLVVLAFFVGNDFNALDDAKGNWLDASQPSWLVRWSATARLIRNSLRLRSARVNVTDHRADSRVAERDSPSASPAIELSERRFWTVLSSRLVLFSARERPRFLRLADRAATVIESLSLAVEAEGVEFLVLLLPDDFQVTPSVLERCLERRHLEAHEIDLDLPQRVLADRLTAQDIDVVDLLPAMREQAVTEDLYWNSNLHWNPAGNRVAGEIVAAAIEDRRILAAVRQ